MTEVEEGVYSVDELEGIDLVLVGEGMEFEEVEGSWEGWWGADCGKGGTGTAG